MNSHALARSHPARNEGDVNGMVPGQVPSAAAAQIRAPGPLSSSWARVGLLVCFLGALFAIVLFEIPVGGTFRERPGGAAPGAGADPRCLALAYHPPDGKRWMPAAVRLRPQIDRRQALRGETWHRADAERDRRHRGPPRPVRW